jgi:hypothetical protein
MTYMELLKLLNMLFPFIVSMHLNLVEQPFMEDSPIAGTEENRRVAQEAIVRLLRK